MTFIKRGHRDRIAYEAACLTWLDAAHGARVVEVLEVGDGYLKEQRLSPAPITSESAEEFGRALWLTHQSGASHYGAPPPAWPHESGWIGDGILPFGYWDSFGLFYSQARILPYLRLATDKGAISSRGIRVIEKLCSALESGDFDDDRTPARTHGDLWTGNLISTAEGLVMIDPAAHGAHCESDLAMLALFGYPKLDTIYDAYAEAANLAAGWRARIGLHQLHPLLNHAALFGGGYGERAVQIAEQYC